MGKHGGLGSCKQQGRPGIPHTDLQANMVQRQGSQARPLKACEHGPKATYLVPSTQGSSCGTMLRCAHHAACRMVAATASWLCGPTHALTLCALRSEMSPRQPLGCPMGPRESHDLPGAWGGGGMETGCLVPATGCMCFLMKLVQQSPWSQETHMRWVKGSWFIGAWHGACACTCTRA